MADVQISALPAATSVNTVDVIPVVQGGVTKRANIAQLPTSGVTTVNTRNGAVTITATDVGLGNVSNTSDANKPVSTAQATALAAKADYPTGGVNGQVLIKNGTTTSWATVGGGGGGSTAGNGVLLAGTGIDPSGTSDSRAGVQAILTAVTAGSTVIVPDGATIRVQGSLTVATRITFTGSGLLNFYGLTSGTINAIEVTADGTTIDGLRMANPSMTQPPPAFAAGGAQVGIYIKASDVKVINSTIDKFESGIGVDSHGEYERIIIDNNRISDVLGSGGGATDTTTQNGENRGDGISIWGAQAVVTNNIINCRPGSDARIGIHHEGLPGNAAVTNAYADADVIIANNIVFGQFRRGIATEDTVRVQIRGNTISDATWWGIATTSGTEVIIEGNIVRWTRTSSDNQGAAWGPTRVPILAFCNGGVVTDLTIRGNTITVAAGSALSSSAGAIHLNGSASPAYDSLVVAGNRIRDRSGAMQSGIRFTLPGTGANIHDNTIAGFTGSGIYLEAPTDFSIRGNRLAGPGSSVSGSAGIFNNASGTGGQVVNNRIRDVAKAVSLVNVTGGLQIGGNALATCATGIDLFGTAVPVVITGNVYTTVATPTANTPTGAVITGNS